MSVKKKKGYLHGFSKKEQLRLYRQAKIVEPEVYAQVDLKSVRELIEVGCGVGAQTKLLLKHFPQMKITGIDASEAQLAQASHFLHAEIAKGIVNLSLQNAMKLDFPSGKFDGAFLCWFLEHVSDQARVLKEVRRVMKKDGVIYCSEVQNASLFVSPYSPALLRYWFLFNDEQWLMRGDPFVGAKLGNLLKETGFRKIEVTVRPTFFDSRNVKLRTRFLNFQLDLLLSAAPALLKAKRVTPNLIARMKKEIAILKKTKDSVFFFTWVQAKAVK